MREHKTKKLPACSILTALLMTLAVGPGRADTKRATQSKNAVLVELFTSEGCSSCPPADKILIELQAQPLDGTEIITLSEHVPYWNYLGWSDPFSQEIFSARQQQYASKIKGSSIYTPQMVIDGKTQIVGNDYSKAITTIRQAALIAKDKIVLEAQSQPSERLKLSGTAMTNRPQTTCIAAIVEDKLVSQVRAGENGGARLLHSSVVREWIDLGSSSAQKILHFEKNFQLNKTWNVKNLRVVVFLQTPTGDITAAATTRAGAGID